MCQPEKKKYKYKYPITTCDCGGKYTKYSEKVHLNSIKHKRYTGEIETPPPATKEKVHKIIDPNSLSYVINHKVSDLNEEQSAKRREYFRHRVAECRQRKKDSLPEEQ